MKILSTASASAITLAGAITVTQAQQASADEHFSLRKCLETKVDIFKAA